MLKERIIKLIGSHQEGEYWDFKRMWYTNNSDLLHDIICMANNLTTNDGYIIIGVDEDNDYSVIDISNDENRKKTQDMVSFLRDKKFAGGIRPKVEVQSVSISGKTIDIIIIKNDKHTPYFITEDYKGVFSNNVYTRVMDTNTPKNSTADLIHIEHLWKKRFGIESTVLERMEEYLQSPMDWEENDEEKKYYKFAPEFTIENVSAAESRQGYEFYLFNQCDCTPHWYDINLYYNQTLLSSIGGVSLDGGRCFTSNPQLDGIRLSKNSTGWDISYRFYVIGSLEYIIHRFYITNNTDDERIARDRYLECVLVFKNDEERSKFKEYVINNYSNYNHCDFISKLPYFPELSGYKMDAFKKEYIDSLILQRMLCDFRES